MDGFPKTGVLKFKQNPWAQCDITLRSRLKSLVSRFKGYLYIPPSSLIFSTNSPFRLNSTFFDILFKGNLFNITANNIDSLEDRHNIDEWISMARAMVILHAGGNSLEVRLQGRVIADATMPPSTESESAKIWTYKLDFLNNLKYILDKTAAPLDFVMSSEEIENDYEQLTFIYQLLMFGLSDRMITYELESTQDIPQGSTAISYANSYFKAGRNLLFWSVKLAMTVERSDSKTLLCKTKSAELLELDIIHEDDYRSRVEEIKQRDDAGIVFTQGASEGSVQ